MSKHQLFLVLVVGLTLNLAVSGSGSAPPRDNDNNDQQQGSNSNRPPDADAGSTAETQQPQAPDTTEQTIQIVIATSPDNDDTSTSTPGAAGEPDDEDVPLVVVTEEQVQDGGGNSAGGGSAKGTRLKFVVDKQFVINSLSGGGVGGQQSPVDPIGATSGFRGTVGRRVTEVPGEWAYYYGEEGEMDGEVDEAQQHTIDAREEALHHYNQGIQLLYPPHKTSPTSSTEHSKHEGSGGSTPAPSLSSTSVYVRSSVGKTAQIAAAYKHFSLGSTHHHESRELTGFAHLLGHHGIPFSIPDAYKLLANLSAVGYPNSQFGIGLLASYGLIKKLDPSVALLHYTFGAASGSAFSSMAMGYRHWGGIGVQTSCERALEQYRTVASIVASEVSESGVGPAIQRVRLLDELEGEQRGGSGGSASGSNVLNSDILDYYSMLAERGDVQAQVGLGQLHFQGGRGISPDHHLALRYFQRAADANSAVAMAFLGKMYLEGNDAVEPDYNLAHRWFQRAAEAGSPVGQSGLGLMYLNGKGLPRDPSKALHYFTLAAEQGWVDGQLQLGNMYLSGIGVRRDYTLAAKYYNLAAQSGHILAIYNLAQMHATGTGMMRSCTAAVELYKSVAERGRWGLLLSEAYAHYQEKRYSNALILYLLLSELGYEAAQSNAAFMLERGEIGDQVYALLNGSSVTPNGMLSKALQQWARSASQGYSPARVRLGDYYYYGWGTNKDYGNAATQYRVASETNRNAQAMFNLAYMHENGLGLKQDLHLAKRFYDMAAETSNDARIPVSLALVKLHLMSYFKGVGLLGGSGGGAEDVVTTESVASGFFEFVSSRGASDDNTNNNNNKDQHTTHHHGDGSSSSNEDHHHHHHRSSSSSHSSATSSSSSQDQFDEYWDLYLITVLIGLLGLLLAGRNRRAQQQQQQQQRPNNGGANNFGNNNDQQGQPR